MAKRKHPTPKSLRTGQTLYQVGVLHPDHTSVTSVRVGSKRTLDPPPEDIIECGSPQLLACALANMPDWMQHYIFYSPLRAESFRKKLQLKLDARYPGRTVNTSVEPG